MNYRNKATHKSTTRLQSAGLVLLGLAFGGCSADHFSSTTTSAATGNAAAGTGSVTGIIPGTTCTLKQVQGPVKVMFVVDASGSNVSETTDDGTIACDNAQLIGCAPATDPLKTLRSGSITAFFNEYQSQTNISWGFEVFQNTGAQSYINTNGLPGFGNAAAMQTAITTFNSEVDNGATPYVAALDNVRVAIANDPDLNSATPPLYFIIMVSDGYPTDAVTYNPTATVDMALLDNVISQITSLAPTRISLSTAYYGTINDANAAATLQNMATAGNGQFVNVDTDSTTSIDIANLITVPTTQCN